MWLSEVGGGGGLLNPSPSGNNVPAWIAYDFPQHFACEAPQSQNGAKIWPDFSKCLICLL